MNSTTISQQLNNRKNSKISTLFSSATNTQEKMTFITHSCDWGVIRNGGRRGAAHGPLSILNQLKKMSLHHQDKDIILNEFKCPLPEQNDTFDDYQERQKTGITNYLASSEDQALIQIGGGHDHIYSLVSNLKGKIHIINLDAHLDTRTDQLFHSGTPFRQLAKEHKDNLKITQIGIQEFSNVADNYQDLASQMNIFSSEGDFLKRENIKSLFQNSDDETIILSLDADAIKSSTMEAVSAVNYNGLSTGFVEQIFKTYYSQVDSKKWKIGIYEYNPIYENLSMKGCRFLTGLIYYGISKMAQK